MSWGETANVDYVQLLGSFWRQGHLGSSNKLHSQDGHHAYIVYANHMGHGKMFDSRC